MERFNNYVPSQTIWHETKKEPTNMKTQHTPGPWSISGNRIEKVTTSESWNKQVPASVDRELIAICDDRLNARLIAFAPDLLKVLKLVHEHSQTDVSPCGVCDLISKAEGRE